MYVLSSMELYLWVVTYLPFDLFYHMKYMKICIMNSNKNYASYFLKASYNNKRYFLELSIGLNTIKCMKTCDYMSTLTMLRNIWT